LYVFDILISFSFNILLRASPVCLLFFTWFMPLHAKYRVHFRVLQAFHYVSTKLTFPVPLALAPHYLT
jgi:hypothetical protein